MSDETKILFDKAIKARLSYKQNLITREEAKEEIMPYINLYNKKSKEIAKKYNVSPKQLNFTSFIR